MVIGDLVLVTSHFELEHRIFKKTSSVYHSDYFAAREGQLLLIIGAKLDRYIVQPIDSDQTFFCLRWHLDTYTEVVSNG